MTSTFITMFDTIDPSAWPADPQAALGYVDGRAGDQPDWAYVQKRFPNAHHLSIALYPANDADCLDIESGAATPESAAAWYERQKARGVARPALYASASVMQATVIPIIRAARIARDDVRLWSAHYTGTPHICGPGSCRMLSIDADGTQWTNQAMGRNLDQSLLLGDFFAVPSPPKPPPVNPPGAPNLSVTGHANGANLGWSVVDSAPERTGGREYAVEITPGTWGTRTVVGQHLHADLKPGKYQARVRAAGDPHAPWSLWRSFTVTA